MAGVGGPLEHGGLDVVDGGFALVLVDLLDHVPQNRYFFFFCRHLFLQFLLLGGVAVVGLEQEIGLLWLVLILLLLGVRSKMLRGSSEVCVQARSCRLCWGNRSVD